MGKLRSVGPAIEKCCDRRSGAAFDRMLLGVGSRESLFEYTGFVAPREMRTSCAGRSGDGVPFGAQLHVIPGRKRPSLF